MRPRLRADLITATAEEDGVTYVEVRDPSTDNSFRFYDFEYALATRLDGRSLEDVRGWAAETYGVELPVDALDAFVDKLTGLGFLTTGDPPSAAPGPAPGATPTRPLAAETAAQRDAGVALEAPREEAARAALGAAPSGADRFGAAPLGIGAASGEPGAQVVGAREGATAAPSPPREASQLEHRFASAPSPLAAILARESPVSGAYHPPGFPAGAAAGAPVGRGAASEEMPIASIAHAIVSDVEGRGQDEDAGGGGGTEPGARDARGGPNGGELAQPAAAMFIRPHRAAAAEAAPRTPSKPDIGPVPEPARRPDREPPPAAAESTLTAEASKAAHSHAEPPESWLSHLRAEVEETPWPPPVAATPIASRQEPAAESRLEAAAAPLSAFEETPSARAAFAPSGNVTPPAPAALPPLPRRRWLPTVLAGVVVLAAVAAVAWFLRPEAPAEPPPVPPPTVHVVSPQPTTFHRWFPTTGVVVPGRDQTLGFQVAGRIQDVLPPGTTFSAGESIARLKGVAERELAVNHLRSRIAFLEQLHGPGIDGGNKATLRDTELKLTARRRELAVATAELAKLEIRPAMAGTIAEVLAEPGSAVAAQAPILRLRAAGPHAVFALAPEQLAEARELGFCRLETIPGSPGLPGSSGDPAGTEAAAPPEGAPPEAGAGAAAAARMTDCTFPAVPVPAPASTSPGPAPGTSPPSTAELAAPTSAGSVLEEPARADFEGKLVLGLPPGTTIPPNTQVRLASARFESVFPVPQSAVVHQDGSNRVWVLTGPAHHVDARPVDLASTEDGVALIGHGLRAGDVVLLDPPPSLKSGDAVDVVQ
jgi:hypothetical protein